MCMDHTVLVTLYVNSGAKEYVHGPYAFGLPCESTVVPMDYVHGPYGFGLPCMSIVVPTYVVHV